MRKIIVLLFVLLALFVIASPTEAHEPDTPEYQDITLTICIDGNLYFYANDTCTWEDWHYTAEMFDFYLEDGIYLIKWTWNVLEDEQAILWVYDYQYKEVLY